MCLILLIISFYNKIGDCIVQKLIFPDRDCMVVARGSSARRSLVAR